MLVVCGEAGVGKTALVESAIGSASGFRVVRAVGVESEMELAFAALQQLCAPMLDRLDRLPAPQRDALGVAFGLTAGNPPDRFLVGLAVLSLLAEVAEEQPLLCVVDDAQWLDRSSAQALVFVARRLLAESVALLLVTREAGDELDGLPRLVVGGLRDGDARALLGSAVRVPLDERVRERLVAETRGNPLALLELPRGLTPGELAGGFGLPDALPLSGRIEDSFRRRFAGPFGGEPDAIAGGGGGAGRRPGAGVASGGAARDRGPGGGRDRRVACDRCAGDLSSPAGPLGGVSSRLDRGQAGRASGAGGSDRPCGRPRPPRLASRCGSAGPR